MVVQCPSLIKIVLVILIIKCMILIQNTILVVGLDLDLNLTFKEEFWIQNSKLYGTQRMIIKGDRNH